MWNICAHSAQDYCFNNLGHILEEFFEIRLKYTVSQFLLLYKWMQIYYFYGFIYSENLWILHLSHYCCCCLLAPRLVFNVFQMKLFLCEVKNDYVHLWNQYEYHSESRTFWFSTKVVFSLLIKNYTESLIIVFINHLKYLAHFIW